MDRSEINTLIGYYLDNSYLDQDEMVIGDSVRVMSSLVNGDKTTTIDGVETVIGKQDIYDEFDTNSLILIPNGISLNLMEFDGETGLRKTDNLQTLEDKVIDYKNSLELAITNGPEGWDGTSRFTVYIIDILHAHTTSHYIFGDFNIPKVVKGIKILDPYIIKDSSYIFTTKLSNTLYDQSDDEMVNPLDLHLLDCGNTYDSPLPISPFERSKVFVKESQISSVYDGVLPRKLVFDNTDLVSQPSYTYKMVLHSGLLNNKIGMISVIPDDSL